MEEMLTDFSQPALATAVKNNLNAFFRLLHAAYPAPFPAGSPVAGWNVGVSFPWLDGVLATRPPTAGDEQAVRDIVAYFQSAGVELFTWWLDSHLETAAWREYLLPHGFGFDSNTPGMAVELAKLPAAVDSPLTIRQVNEEQLVRAWSEVMVQGFGLPEGAISKMADLTARLGTDLPFGHYLGFVDDRPVATSTLFLAAGVAGIYNVTALPVGRGRGAGSAITLAPLRAAQEMGYHVGILQSSKMGYNVYRRLGFEEVCSMDHFFWRAAEA